MAEGGQVGGGGRKERRLPPEVNRALYVRNLPFSAGADEIYDIFGKYGAIRQVRLGCEKDTRGRAYVVFEDIHDAKNACDHLSGYSVGNRYLIVSYHQPSKQLKAQEAEHKEAEVADLRRMADEAQRRAG